MSFLHMYTAVFSVARTVGWVAHWKEMIEEPTRKISRPRQLYSGYQDSGVSFSKELANILDTWTKTWVVSGLIPGTPPVPFSGPLS